MRPVFYRMVGWFMIPEEDRVQWAKTVGDIPAEWAEEVAQQGYQGWEIVENYQVYSTKLGFQ